MAAFSPSFYFLCWGVAAEVEAAETLKADADPAVRGIFLFLDTFLKPPLDI
ncbi:MAG: hypothetical protein HQK86_12785 [Nitrospinae bacterium]|nr:hypothetical protein [Nitrospinota bacterium]MBF0634742.1 hypothetical protein [Nitrospinota bacterium]